LFLPDLQWTQYPIDDSAGLGHPCN
jgi:hypothetical protein